MKIIFFCSNPASWSIAFHEAIIAKALKDRGHHIIFITPGTQLHNRSNFLHEKILRKEFNLEGYTLDQVVDDRIRMQVDDIMGRLNKNNFEDLIVDGVKLGKIALYEPIITYKKTSVDFNDEQWRECLHYIRNTLISYFACQKIIEREKPDRIMMYNTLYSVNRVWEKHAESRGIPVYFIHHGQNLSSREDELIIGRGNTIHFTKLIKNNEWPKYKNIPIPTERISSITNHFLKLLEAKSMMVYSVPKSKDVFGIRKIFGIKESQKILTATLSSYDEIFAGNYVEAGQEATDSPFRDQIDWVKNLIEHLRKRPDWFLIIRVHPREFPNKVESVRSEHSKKMEEQFQNLPDNVVINWPDQKISLYDLAEYTDVFLNAWSNVGTEMSMLGLPVVIYSSEIVFYPSDLNYVGTDKEDYFKKINHALLDGWKMERVIQTYRWLSLLYMETVVKVRTENKIAQENFIQSQGKRSLNFYNLYNSLPLFIKKFLKQILKKLFNVKEGRDLINRCRIQLKEKVDVSKLEAMLKTAVNDMIDREKILSSALSPEEEKRCLLKEFDRLYKALYQEKNPGMFQEKSLQEKLKKILHK